MAFACGPFAKIESPLPAIPGIEQGSTLRTWFRESERKNLDEPTLHAVVALIDEAAQKIERL